MIENPVRQSLLEGIVIDCFVRSADANLAEYVATGGWDSWCSTGSTVG